jgi:hypothetical protein
MQRIFSTLGLAFGVAGCEASPSSTANTETDSGVIVADTDACDLGEYACPIGFPCTSVRIGDGSCVDLPEGEGLRLYGDPACVLGMLRDGTTGNFFVDVCPATSPPLTDYVTVLGDGTADLARVRAATQSPTNEWFYRDPDRRIIVKPPEFFDACIGSEDLSLVLECLTTWYEPELCMPDACCPVDNQLGHPPC